MLMVNRYFRFGILSDGLHHCLQWFHSPLVGLCGLNCDDAITVHNVDALHFNDVAIVIILSVCCGWNLLMH